MEKIKREMVELDVYLIDEAKNYTFQFPVNPLEKISIQKEKKFTTVDIIDFGEVDIPDRGEKIVEISFDTLLPKEYDSAYCRYIDITPPKEALMLLEYWKNIEQPVRLIITDLEFNNLVYISKLNVEERAGEIGDKYISITFRTYREIKIETVNNASNENLGGLQNNRSTQSSDFSAGDMVTVTASALNVREGPGTDYNILGSVPKETNLELYRIQGNWSDVYWGDHGGWICLDYVTK